MEIKTSDGHLGCHIVWGVMLKDASLVSIGFTIYIPASQKGHLRCHPVCMQLPTNASLAFFGFILCLTTMIDFGSPDFFIHFGYYLLSELRNYVFYVD